MTLIQAKASPDEAAEKMITNTHPTHRTRPPAMVFVLLVISLLVVFTPIFARATSAGDFKAHTQFALDLKASGDFSELPHFLYHVMFLAFDELLPWVSNQTVSALPVLTATILLGLMLFTLLNRTTGGTRPVLMIPLTVSLLLISPVMLWLELPYAVGYVHPTVYHNPTQNILKLFVIPVSLFALRVIRPEPYASLRERGFVALVSASFVVLMTLSKPNYTICILPGLGLYVLYRIRKRRPIDWGLLVFGFGLPAAGVLGIQFLGTYSASDDSSVAIGFMVVLRRIAYFHRLPLQFLLSLLFPAAVYLAHRDAARQDAYLNLSWVTFFIGAIFMYFFHETGSRLEHGNFIWSGHITSFVLMYASVVFLLREYGDAVWSWSSNTPWQLKLTDGLFALHVLSGIRYYLAYFLSGYF
jgi:hypothetical protein